MMLSNIFRSFSSKTFMFPALRHVPRRMGSLSDGPWDVNNRIKVIGTTVGLVSAGAMLFDTFYRRATKHELSSSIEKLDKKIDKGIGHLDSKIDTRINSLSTKIDGLTNALLHSNQPGKAD